MENQNKSAAYIKNKSTCTGTYTVGSEGDYMQQKVFFSDFFKGNAGEILRIGVFNNNYQRNVG